MADTITREELIALCEKGRVPEEKWSDRDSAKAQMQMGVAWALLSAGCDFEVLDGTQRGARGELRDLISDKNTWWVEMKVRGFDFHENGGPEFNDGHDFRDSETAYIPTAARLKKCKGEDWY